MADDTERATRRGQLRTALLTPAAAAPRLRGLYDVAQLAYLLQSLGYATDSAHWEANIEGDDSEVPAMLGEALTSLGKTLIAMTTEEVSELLANSAMAKAVDEEKGETIEAVERAYVDAAKTDRARLWRRTMVHLRAGKALSAANAAKLGDACTHMDRAAKAATGAAGSMGEAADHQEAMGDSHAKATAAHQKATDAIEAASGAPPEDVAAKLAKVQQHHRAVGKHLAAIGERCAAIGDVQADAQGSIAGAQRCMRSAMRCVRAVTGEGDEPPETQNEEVADGDRAFAADYRRRQAALLELAAA